MVDGHKRASAHSYCKDDMYSNMHSSYMFMKEIKVSV